MKPVQWYQRYEPPLSDCNDQQLPSRQNRFVQTVQLVKTCAECALPRTEWWIQMKDTKANTDQAVCSQATAFENSNQLLEQVGLLSSTLKNFLETSLFQKIISISCIDFQSLYNSFRYLLESSSLFPICILSFYLPSNSNCSCFNLRFQNVILV